MAKCAPEELASLDSERLAETLVTLANEVRDDLREGRHVRALSLLEELQQAARRSAGPQLALLEVAIAVLKAVTRTDLGRPELVIHEMLAEESDDVDAFLTKACEGVARASEVSRLPRPIVERIARLRDLGVIRELQGVFDVALKYRALVSELIEPLPFRLWREVTDVRNEIMAQHLPEHQAASLLAGQFGLGQQQAVRHLRRHPPLEWLSTKPMGQRYQRPPIVANGSTVSSPGGVSIRESDPYQQPGEATDDNVGLVRDALIERGDRPTLQ